MTTALGAAELRAHVGRIRQKARITNVIGVHSAGTWSGPDSIDVDQVTYDVVSCPSALAVREQLARPLAEDRGLVLLIDRDERDLGLDVLARFAKERLLRLDLWTSVRELFGARELDPALVDKPWLARALVQSVPLDGYPKVPTGLLDQETAWDALLTTRLGLRARPPSLSGLLDWTLNEMHAEAWEGLDEELQRGALAWWQERAGSAVIVLEQCLRVGRSSDAIPIALACGVLFDDSGRDEIALQKAAARLETTLGLDELPAAIGRRVAAAAESVVRQLRSVAPRARLNAILQRGDAVLSELKAADQAYRSHILPSGFDQRRVQHAAALVRVVDGEVDPEELVPLEEAVERHEATSKDPEAGTLFERVRMATRLARWLRRPERATPSSLAEAALGYAGEEAWVDQAREAMRRGGDSKSEVRDAHRRLLEAAGARREAQNRRFATLLADWSTTVESQDDSVIPIERVLDTIVAPLAQETRLLLLVVDGMSLPVFTELLDDFDRQGFVERSADEKGRRAVALAALPTVTEVSRTSLLCGAIRNGTQDTERAVFADHAALRAAAGSTGAPHLLHKAQLKNHDGGGLAEEVRAEIADKRRRVVGVVLNAIDDHLLKGDQARFAWSVDHITPLQDLLSAARDGERAIVVTSDHGHVLEHGLEYRKHEDGGERWRPHQGTVDEREVVVRGPRVVAATGDAVILPWSERIRYGAQKNGYHGGATPQEVVVPVAVFSAGSLEIDGWPEAVVSPPDWWFGGMDAALPDGAAKPKPVKKKAPPKGLLFDTRPQAESDEAGMVGRLVASKVYAEQKKLAGRSALPDERVEALIGVLEQHGGKMTRMAFAKAVGLTSMRLPGYLATLRRVLNVDGYSILSTNEEDQTITLDLRMMETQFEL